MRVTVVYVPKGVFAGHPPIRLAEEVHVYPSGECVTRGLRTIVWQSIDFVLRAFANGVTRELFDSWVKTEVETDVFPCVPCCEVVSDMVAHIAEKHPAPVYRRPTPPLGAPPDEK